MQHVSDCQDEIVGRAYTECIDAYDWDGWWPVVHDEAGTLIVTALHDGTAANDQSREPIFADVHKGRLVNVGAEHANDVVVGFGD